MLRFSPVYRKSDYICIRFEEIVSHIVVGGIASVACMRSVYGQFYGLVELPERRDAGIRDFYDNQQFPEQEYFAARAAER